MRFEDALLIRSPMKQSRRRISDTSRLRNPVFVGKTSYSAHGGNLPDQGNLKSPLIHLCSTKSPDAGCESTRGTERRRTARCPGTNQVHQGVGPTASMYKQYQARKARAAPVSGTAKLQDDGMPFQTRSQNGEKPAERERKPHGGVAAADTGEKA